MTAALIAAAAGAARGRATRAAAGRARTRKASSRAPWPEVGAKIQRVVGKIEREPAARLFRREQPRLGRRAAHEAAGVYEAQRIPQWLILSEHGIEVVVEVCRRLLAERGVEARREGGVADARPCKGHDLAHRARRPLVSRGVQAGAHRRGAAA